MINELAKQIFENNKAKGFYDSPKNIGEMLCLIHSEVSEALEADRNDKYSPYGDADMFLLNEKEDNATFVDAYANFVKGTFEEEMADIVNSLRQFKHGKKY
jgi:hypothetical protein